MSIIKSLLDLDFYKLTMAQVAFKYFPEVVVGYGFTNRTRSVSLHSFLCEEDLRREVELIRSLRFTPEELAFLAESEFIPRGMFSKEFLAFLANLRLPELEIEFNDSTLKIEVEGRWVDTILWETLILSVINELYYRKLTRASDLSKSQTYLEGEGRLDAKVKLLNGDVRVRFSDFGTRRRFSGVWQRHVVEVLAKKLPVQFVGTSNVLLARDLGLRPIGTFAHEMDMIFSGIYHDSDEEIRASHQKVLQLWWEMYGEPLSIALTDTYGTEFFFSDMTLEQAKSWRGLRQDSGDPFAFGERAIKFYEERGIDPREKTIVFSDGLEVGTILGLTEQFSGRIQVVFGWGTNLTNDLGFAPLSLVVKAIRSCGHGTVKLSDNLDKAIGNPADIERFTRIFGAGDIPHLGVKY